MASSDQGEAIPAPAPIRVSAYGWYALFVLVLVYIINFVDRQIISILAQDIKSDLNLEDAQIGFLYGTAFAVFYALFGIPLGRLADSWYRGRLIALGLGLWSTMTALSGFASSFAMLATARIGVGIGEASASPAAYSMISDYFPKEKRATALSIYSAGLYIGGGLSLPVGGLVSSRWNAAFPHAADAPLGLVGWQAAFLAVGIPGLLLALWVLTLREPQRGATDRLQAVRERLGCGDRPVAREDEQRLMHEPPSRNEGLRPELLDALFSPFAPLDGMEMHRLVEEVGAEKKAETRHAAAVVAEVDDHRVGVGEERHRGGRGVAAELGIDEAVELHESDVSGQPLHLLETEVLRGCEPTHAFAVLRRRFAASRFDDRLRRVVDPEVRIGGEGSDARVEPHGELLAVETIELAERGALAKVRRDLLSRGLIDV